MRTSMIVIMIGFVAAVATWAIAGKEKPGQLPAEKLAEQTMPEFVGIETWLNSEPIASKDLKGKVTVVHFWTNGCVNCVHNYPHYRAWTDRYKDNKSLVIIGVHSPEFDSEKDIERLKKRAADHKLTFPIAVDNSMKTWAAWGNRYWPCVYLVDKSGKIRHRHEGELGEEGYKKVTAQIDALLAEK